MYIHMICLGYSKAKKDAEQLHFTTDEVKLARGGWGQCHKQLPILWGWFESHPSMASSRNQMLIIVAWGLYSHSPGNLLSSRTIADVVFFFKLVENSSFDS